MEYLSSNITTLLIGAVRSSWACFVLRHHIENVMHDSSSKLEVVIGLDMLFGDSHGNAP
jgi:hypothetical protein